MQINNNDIQCATEYDFIALNINIILMLDNNNERTVILLRLLACERARI